MVIRKRWLCFSSCHQRQSHIFKTKTRLSSDTITTLLNIRNKNGKMSNINGKVVRCGPLKQVVSLTKTLNLRITVAGGVAVNKACSQPLDSHRGQTGGDSPCERRECIAWVWPTQTLHRITSSRRTRHPRGRSDRLGRMACSLNGVHSFLAGRWNSSL